MNSQIRFIFFILLFIWILSTPTNNEERYPPFIDKSFILNQFKNEINISRNALISDYNLGYGNLTGFRLSYQDAMDNRNISRWPFPDKKGNFIEDEKFSILPNFISRKAANIWNTEGNCIKLPINRNDNNDEIIGKKINSGDFPLNISGLLRGDFQKVNLTNNNKLVPIHMPLPNYLTKLYEFRTREKRNNNNNKGNDDDDDNNDINDTNHHDQEDYGSLDVDMLPVDDHFKKIGNFTEDKGLVQLSFANKYITTTETDADNTENKLDFTGITSVDLSLTISDVLEKDEHILSLSGLYYQNDGNILVSTRSAKFAGPYGLPELTLSPDKYFNQSRYALFDRFNETKIENLELKNIEKLVDNSDRCEYIGYFHIESTNLTKEELKQIDYELTNPIGRPHRAVPKIKLTSGLLYSPNCAILLDLGKASGVRNEIFGNSLKHTMLVASITVLLQIWILIRQMAQTNTPSTLSRLSFWTISMINMTDGTISVISLLCSMVYNELYIQFSVCAFLAFTCSAIYEMKYGIQIYCTQINERPLDWRTMLQGTPVDERSQLRDQNATTNTSPSPDNNNNTTNNNNNNNTTTNTTTTTTPSANVDEQAIGAELYTRHFFAMLVFLFVLVNVITWPKKQRLIFEYLFITIFNSFWIPQIYRNVLRGSRTSFTWEFILSISILRLIPIIYIDVFTNSFHHHKDIGFVIFIIFWVSIQLIVLFLQEILGPRFFLSEAYLPKTYDYHPIISKGDIESGFNLNADEIVSDRSSSSNEDSRDLKYVTDCAICMQKVEVPIIDSNELTSNYNHSDHNDQHNLLTAPGIGLGKSTTNLMARRKYMITPCNHVFHTDCLENWMMYKLQCPVCRNSLPPF